MSVRLGAVVLILAIHPRAVTGAPAQGPGDPLAEARRLFNERGPLAGAEHAAAAFPRPDLPDAMRRRLGLFSSNSYAMAYEELLEESRPDPSYLCRALAMLAASARFSREPDEVESHRRLLDARRETLEQNHPGHRCDHELEVASESPAPTAAPAPAVEPTPAVEPAPQVNAPRPGAPARQPSPEVLRLRRRAQVWTALGGTSLGLAVASFAAMGGALGRREALGRQADGYDAPDVLSPAQVEELQADRVRFWRAHRLAVATGVAGTVMAITGISAIVRGRALKRRIRAAPDVGSGRAAVVFFGRF